MRSIETILGFIFISCLLFAYSCKPTTERAQPSESTKAATKQRPGSEEGEDHDHEHDHEHEATPPQDDDGPLIATRAVGAPIPDDVELVDAAAIVTNPDEYAGRRVKIAGTVKGFCHHRRAWFAIDVPNANPPYLRVITAPEFLVPSGAMNAEVTAIGVVEVTETPRSRLSHYEREHKLGAGAEEAAGRGKRAIIRATGASFTPTG